MTHEVPATPTLDKLAERDDERRAVLDFLEWLSEEQDNAKRIHLARWVKYTPDDLMSGEYLAYITEKQDNLVMRWLGLDPDQVERERRALLASLR